MQRGRYGEALAALVLVLVPINACGGPRARVVEPLGRGDIEQALVAYEELRARAGADPGLLAVIAERVLADSVDGEDAALRGAAISQLRAAGLPGRQLLADLSRRATRLEARVASLAALAREGDRASRFALRRFAGSIDAEVRACGVLGWEPIREESELINALRDPSPLVRRVAAEALATDSESSTARMALEDVARVDPDDAVRARAVRTLGAFGEPALRSVRERLGDSALAVRIASVGALGVMGGTSAWGVLGTLLAGPPESVGLEAARILATAQLEQTERSDATRYLSGALRSADASVRAQAGQALASLPADRVPVASLLDALDVEVDPSTRLALAAVMLGRATWRAPAERALVRLLDSDGMVRVQAAAALAAHEHERAAQVLAEALRATDAALRRVAARTLAGEAHRPDEARSALSDDDGLVRVYAAGGMLRQILSNR